MHPKFHVSLLKPAPSAKYSVSPNLPDVDDQMQIPESILQRRMHPRQSGSVAQVLVKLSRMDPELATWKDAEALQQRFPDAPAWGHAGLQGEGSVTAPHHGSALDVQPRRSRRARAQSK